MRGSRIKYSVFSVLLVVNIFVTSVLNAQFFSFGNDPGRLKWRYIESDRFRVIYPAEIDSLAKRYAWLLDTLKEPVHKSLNVATSPLDVVLHPYSALSNGMVGWAPSRMELITMAPANDHYVHNWEKHLTIHELRHIAQVSKFKHGIFKPLGWLIGEQAAALGTGLFMSQWKLEGDAIISETEFTSGGRGRDPDHLIFYKAAFLEGDYRNWNRWTMGSYKEYVPDPYSFGYLYTSFVRQNSDNYDYLGEVTDYIVSHFYDLRAQSKGYKKFTGLSKKENYEEMKRFYTKKWREEDSLRAPFKSGEPLLDGSEHNSEDYSSYLYPLFYNEIVFALKKSLDDIPELVKITPEGEEFFVRHIGRVNSPMKIFENQIYWTESIISPRWDLESYSDVFSYNIESRKTKRHTSKERLFNPALSVSGDTLIAISYGIQGNSELVLYDRSNFSELSRSKAPDGYRLKEAVTVPGGIIASAVTDTGIALFYSQVPGDGSWELIVNSQGYIISDLAYDYSSGKLIFISDLNGVKNLYAMDTDKKSIAPITNVHLGLSGYNKGKGKALLISDYSKSGYSVKKTDFEIDTTKKHSFINAYQYDIADELSTEAPINADTLMVPENTGYVSRPYRKSGNLFRIHSWAPVYYNVDNIKNLTYETIYDLVAPGFILYSQNSLSTAYTMAGYAWQNGFHTGHFKFSYHGLFPVIEFESSINTRNRMKMNTEIDGIGFIHNSVDEIEGSPLVRAGLRVYVPMTWNKGGWNSGVIPRAFWRYTNDSFFSIDKGKYSFYQYGNVGVSLFRVLNKSHRDIFPKKGGGLSLLYSAVPFSGENFGSLLYGSAYYYLPGITKGHGSKLSVSAQKQLAEGKNYLMSNAIRFPYGYEDRFSKSAVLISGEYAMPLYTGDISLTEMLYIKRVQLIPFFNYCMNDGQLGRENLWSAGGDLLLDLNLLGISYPLVLGIRGGINGDSRNFFEFLFKTPL